MAEYVLKLNERNKKAKALLDFLMSYASDSDAVEIEKRPNATTIAAIKAVENGEYTMLKKGHKIESILDDV